MIPHFPVVAMVFAAMSLSACTLEMPQALQSHPQTPAQPRQKPQPVMPDAIAASAAKAGTCYAYVQTEADGSATLFTGVGAGSVPPVGQVKTDLSPARADAAYAKELEIMKINPECLSTYTVPRQHA